LRADLADNNLNRSNIKKVIYHIGRLTEEEQLKLDFLDGLSRTVYERIELGFIPIKLPVIDEERYRIFSTLKEYRKWADENTPSWLGYHCKDDR
jgi:hypothetical protein